MRDLRFWRRRHAEDDDLDRELEVHLSLEIEEQVERGVPLGDARLAARRAFGSVALAKEELRDMNRGAALDRFRQDFRYAARLLRKAPGFTFASVLVLAVGIGATTVIFSLVDAALLRPLPLRNPGQLVMVWERSPQAAKSLVSPPTFVDWVEQSHAFASIAATGGMPGPWPLIDETRPIPETVMLQTVTTTFFDVLGVTPLLGRTFRPGDGNVANVKVISERLWRNRFGADPRIVGRPIRLSSPTFLATIIGVVPDSAQVLGTTDVWECTGDMPRSADLRGSHVLQVIARMKPNVTIEQARADMAVVAANVERAAPATNRGWSTTIEPLQQAIVGDDLRTTSLMLGAVVLFVLLLACANIANLILARGLGRTQEIAVRAALGGSRGRIARQLLTESALLGVLGGATGLGLSWVILRIAPSVIPRGTLPAAIALGVDWRVAAFAAIVTVGTSLLFGLAPAWQAARVPLVEAMTSGGRGTTDRAGRIRHALAVLEIAAALLLTTGASLLLRTLVSLNGVDAGYRAEHVITMTVKVPFMRIRAQSELAAYYQSIADEIGTTPGVLVSAIGTDVPLAGTNRRQPFEIVGDAPPDQANRPSAHYQMVGSSYFDALGVPLRRGRAFTPQDTRTAPQVCIVNEEFARRYFSGREALGAHVIIPSIELPPRLITREIVGVIGQIKTRPDEPLDNALEVYVPLAQNTTTSATLVVRAVGNPLQLMPSIQQAIARVDRAQAVSRVRTMEDVALEATARPRFRAQLVGIFAVFAVVLAAVGTFSVLTFMVQQRAREFSLRRALGATPGDVLRLVLGNGARIIVLGVGAGLALSATLVRSLSGLLFGVTPLDPVTFVAAPSALALTALLACVAPAVRALRTDPAAALREH
jgi:putative ABC transport system permease protein